MAFAGSLQGAVIFQNTQNDTTTTFTPGVAEVGDEIVLGGPERWLTSFSFEYWGTASGASFAGPVQAQVRFYLNNGPLFNDYATPGTMFYDSGLFSVPSPTERNTFLFNIENGDFAATGLYIPAISNLTWSVQFQGMGLGDQVGLDIYSPPTVGTSASDYWQKNGSWHLMTNTVAMNFAAQFEAQLTPVPEPSSFAFFALGGLGLLAFINRLRR